MITLPPYMYDREAYLEVPVEHRWLMNKLMLSERLGYDCAPVGTRIPTGDFCVRPIMNLHGMGAGGFKRWTAAQARGIPNRPGYFWNEWFDGEQGNTEFINDVPVYTVKGTLVGDTIKYVETNDHVLLPDFLKGISRYVLIEYIDGKIIEFSFRHMGENARQDSIDDYKTIDPTYDPTADIQFGMTDMLRVPAPEGGWKWIHKPGTRRPIPPRT